MSINKQGVWKGNNFLNYAYRTIISPNIIQEPDGSVWLQVFHHNNPANNLFTSTDTFTIGVYKDENKWFNFNLCNICSKWEILVKQKPISTGTEVKYRWIQTANPMICAFADVDAADITKITTSGYTAMGSAQGGLYKKVSSTYLCQNNAQSGNWWGAVGAWTNHQGGIPGINGIVVTSGYLDIYIRIDNDSLITTNKAKIFNNQDTIANNFIEI